MHHATPRLRILLAVLALALGAAGLSGCVSDGPPRTRRAALDRQADEAAEVERRARMHYRIGVERLREGRTPEAIGELLQSVRIDPNQARTRLALAEAYRRVGRYPEAEEHLRAALQIDPDFHEAHLNLSALYIQLQRYEESIAHTRRLLEDPTFPQPWRALTNLGWAELQLGQVRAAAEHLQLALDYRDDYWPARLNLGILEASRGRPAEAIAHLERVLEAGPGPSAEAEVRYRLAEQYEALGDRRSAIRELSAAVDLRSGGPWSKRSAEYLETLQ